MFQGIMKLPIIQVYLAKSSQITFEMVTKR